MYQREPEYDEYDYYQNRPGDLQKLDQLDEWELKPGEPDIRGWDVVDDSGQNIGSVDSLLASVEAEQVVFIVVNYGGTLGMGENKSLVPMDHIDIDTNNRRVIYHGSADDFRDVPKYSEDTRDYNQFYDYWSGRRGIMGRERETAEERGVRVIPEVEERLDVGKREEQVGEVTVRKEVETHQETVNVPVQRMKVHIYRRDVEPGREVRSGEQVLREGETIKIPIVEEKLVTEKRQQVTGEVVVQPEVTQEQEQVTRDLRREHVTVEKQGDVEMEEEEEERTHRR